MSKILQNTTGSNVAIADTGITIAASGSYTIPPQDYPLWASSSDVIIKIGDGTLTVSDGSSTLSLSAGVDLIKGIFPQKIESYFHGPTIDSVGRLRSSDVSIIGSYCFYSSNHDLDFNTQLSGSATNSFVAAAAASRMTTTTSGSDSVVRQSKRYFSYSPGIGHSYGMALTVGAKKANVRQRWGHFDTTDGAFFEQTATNLFVVIRSSTSGSPVDTAVAQADWNLDKLDGTGPSGITLDPSKHNKYVIDMSWYGAGTLRFGIFSNGITLYCHQVNTANLVALPYTRSPKRPIRFELTNLGTVASNTSMDIVCISATQESSAPFLPSYNFSKSLGRVGISVGATLIPLLSIRTLATFNGIANRVSLFVTGLQVLTNQQPILVQILFNPTLTGASFSSVNSFSGAETDVTATAVSGGAVVAEFYVSEKGEASFDLSKFSKTVVISNSIAGNGGGDVLTIAAISTAGGSTSWATLQWEEAQ